MNGLKLRRGDYVILLLAVIAVIACCWMVWRPRTDGKTAVVATPVGETSYALSTNTTFTIEGNNGIRLTVEIDGGRVRVQSSECADQVCVHSGWLSKNGQSAACVPAGVSVRVVGSTWEVDGVTA